MLGSARRCDAGAAGHERGRPTRDLPGQLRRPAPTILFRTAEGTKLVSAAMNNHVVFEVDDHNVAEGWSVIVKGTARSLRTDEEIEDAERAQVLSWTTL